MEEIPLRFFLTAQWVHFSVIVEKFFDYSLRVAGVAADEQHAVRIPCLQRPPSKALMRLAKHTFRIQNIRETWKNVWTSHGFIQHILKSLLQYGRHVALGS